MRERTIAAWNRYADAANRGEPQDVCSVYRAWYLAALDAERGAARGTWAAYQPGFSWMPRRRADR